MLIASAGFALFFSSVALVEEFVEWRRHTEHHRSKDYCYRLLLENAPWPPIWFGIDCLIFSQT